MLQGSVSVADSPAVLCAKLLSPVSCPPAVAPLCEKLGAWKDGVLAG